MKIEEQSSTKIKISANTSARKKKKEKQSVPTLLSSANTGSRPRKALAMTVAWGDKPVVTESQRDAEASPHGGANGTDNEMGFVVFTLRGPDGVGMVLHFLHALNEVDEDAAVVDMNQVIHEDKLLMHLLVRASNEESKSAIVKSMLLAAKAVTGY